MADQNTASQAIPIRVLIVDTNGNPVPGGSFSAVTIANGGDFAQGSVGDTAWVSGDGTVIALLKKIASGGGSAVSIADGSDVAEGTTTNAAITSDANGTVTGFLRGLVKMVSNVWDSGNSRLNVAVQNIPHAIIDTGSTTAATQATAANLKALIDINAGQSVQANAGTNLNTSALALAATQTDRTQKVQITDGTRDGTIKAASTLPVATDTATVVTLRDSPAVTGSVTANAGTNLNTSLLALDSTVAKDATIVSSNTKLDTLHTDLSTTTLTTIDTDIKAQAKLTDTQPVSMASVPVGAATEAAATANFETLANLLRTTNAILRSMSMQLSMMNSPRIRIEDLTPFIADESLS